MGPSLLRSCFFGMGSGSGVVQVLITILNQYFSVICKDTDYVESRNTSASDVPHMGLILKVIPLKLFLRYGIKSDHR